MTAPTSQPTCSSDSRGPLSEAAVGRDDVTVLDLDGGRAKARAVLSRPSWIAGYEVVAELGRGGMGVVYRARDEKLGRDVALKVLRAHDATTETRQRFELEARAAARLRHPNIVAVHQSGEDESGAPYVVMELVRGPTLRDVLRRDGPLPAPEAARLMETLARALAAAHAEGVLHRDVKPQNVLLAPTGEPMLADFGLAKVFDSPDGPTTTGQVLGTPQYMSPEQADGDDTKLGPTTDVWALGATFYEALTGRTPFNGVTVLATIAAVLQKDPAPPSSLRPDIDRDLETIVLTCLEKEPSRRYPTAGALADDLERWRRGGPVNARPPGAARRARRWLGQHRAAVLTALLALGLGASLLTRARAVDGRRAEALATLAEARALARRGRGADQVAPLVSRALLRGDRAPEVLVEGALVLEVAGLLRDARSLLEEAASEHPPAYEALLELHRLELREDARGSRMTRALEEVIRRASRRGDDDEFALFARAEQAVEQEDLVSALAIHERIERLAPKFALAHVNRANVREALGDRSGARRDLDRALDVDPELAIAWSNRASLRGADGDLTGALQDADRAVTLDPSLAAAWSLRGALRRALGDPAPAMRDLARALELDADLPPARLLLGTLLLEQGRADPTAPGALEALEAARTHLDRAVALAPGDPVAWARRGEVRALLGHSTAALADHDRALGLAPDLREVWLARGLVELELEEYARAIDDIDRALALEPAWADALWHRARVRSMARDLPGAREDLDSALVVDPDHVDARLARAALRRDAGDLDGAREDLRAALRVMTPDDPRRDEVRRSIE